MTHRSFVQAHTWREPAPPALHDIIASGGLEFGLTCGANPAGEARMSEQQWYMAKNGHQIGPMAENEIVGNVHNGSADGKTLVSTAGMSN